MSRSGSPLGRSSLTRRVAIFALFLAAASATAAPTPGLADLEWLLGAWGQTAGDGMLIERWRAAGARTFEGEGLFVGPDGEARLSEALLLAEMAGDLFYIARPPENEEPVAFRLTEIGDRRARFENPDHDFPQSLLYERTDDGTLVVTVEGQGDEPGERRGFQLHLRPVDQPTLGPSAASRP